MKVADLKPGVVIGNAHKGLSDFKIDDTTVLVDKHDVFLLKDGRKKLEETLKTHDSFLPPTYRDGQIIILGVSSRVECLGGHYDHLNCIYHWGGGWVGRVYLKLVATGSGAKPHIDNRVHFSFNITDQARAFDILSTISPIAKFKEASQLDEGDVIGRVEDGFHDFMIEGSTTVVSHCIQKPAIFCRDDYPRGADGDIVVTASLAALRGYRVSALYVWREHVGSLELYVDDGSVKPIAPKCTQVPKCTHVSTFVPVESILDYLMAIPEPSKEKS